MALDRRGKMVIIRFLMVRQEVTFGINLRTRISYSTAERLTGITLDKFSFNNKELGGFWFGNRVTDDWNRLQDHGVSVGSLNSLKIEIDNYMSEKGWI